MKTKSGAELVVKLAPFADSKALYQALCEEGLRVKLDAAAEIDKNFFKDVFCVAMSSPKIERALWPCMERSTYNGMKIVPDTFETASAREDFIDVCMLVTEENVRPFLKNLSALFSPILERVKSSLA